MKNIDLRSNVKTDVTGLGCEYVFWLRMTSNGDFLAESRK